MNSLQSRNDETPKNKILNIIIDFDEVTGQNTQEHNTHWPKIPNHPYKILTVGGFGSGETNALLSIINCQPDIDKIYFNNKHLFESKYQFLIKNGEGVGLKYFKDSMTFVEYSNYLKGVYKSIEDYSPGKERKIVIVFDDMIADVTSYKRFHLVVTELFVRGQKLYIYLWFITQLSYFYRSTLFLWMWIA